MTPSGIEPAVPEPTASPRAPIVKSNTDYFVARQRWKEEQLLHFHVNTEHFSIVDSCFYVNNKKGT
jgi:hypothetical protein